MRARCWAGAGQKLLLDPAPVSHQGEFVARACDYLRQHDSGRRGLIELGDGEHVLLGGVLFDLSTRLGLTAARLECRAREPACVEHDPNLLGAFGGELAGDEVGRSSGRGPRNVSHFVARLVVAQALELAAGPAHPQAAFLEFDLARTHQVEGCIAGALLGRGEDADALIASGIDRETPCVAVSKASTAEERVHRTTLAGLEDGAVGPAPVLLLIGYAIRVA